MPFSLQGGQFLYGDGTPIASGVLTLTLVGGPATLISTGAAAASSYTFNLDVNGVIIGPANVNGNAELTPAGTNYTAKVTVAAVTVWGPFTWIVGPSAPYAGTLFPDVSALPLISGIAGTVTSVNETVPAFLTIAGTPITVSGTLAIDLRVESPFTFLAGPLASPAIAPYFRSIQPSDLPNSPVVFQASGINRMPGLVPDPGSVAGTTRFLREDATWQSPAAGASLVLDNTWTNNNRFKGPIPHWDVTAFGATSHDYAQGPFTGTISSGSKTLTLTAAGDWANGQGIAVIGAGATATVAAPDWTSYTISTVSRAANVTTITTTAPHTVLANSFILTRGVTDTSFNGVSWVTAVTSTTITTSAFSITGPDGSSSGGTVVPGVAWFQGTAFGSTTYNYKVISVDQDGGYSTSSVQLSVTNAIPTLTELESIWLWWNKVTNADYYCIYRNGTFIGRTYTNGYKDQGDTYPRTQNTPNAAPGAAGPKTLLTTVSAGAGTTTLTLAAAASTTATSQNVYHDESSFINAAIASAVASMTGLQYTAPVVIPHGLYWVTRIKWPITSGLRIKLVGNLRLTTHPLIMDSINSCIEGDSGAVTALAYSSGASGFVFGSESPEGIVTKTLAGATGQTIKNISITTSGTGQHGMVIAGGGSGITLNDVTISTSGKGKGIVVCDGNTIFMKWRKVRIQTDSAQTGPPAVHFSSWGIQGSWVDIDVTDFYANFHSILIDTPLMVKLTGGQPATFQHVSWQNTVTESQKDSGFFVVASDPPTAPSAAVTFPDNLLFRSDFADNVSPFTGTYHYPRTTTGSTPTLIQLHMQGSNQPIGLPNKYDQIGAYRVFDVNMGGGRLDGATFNQWQGTGGYVRVTSEALSMGVPFFISYLGDGSGNSQSFAIAIPRPRQDPASDIGVTGTLAAGTYWYVVSALDGAGGETVPSNEISFVTLANHGIQLNYSTGGMLVKYASKYRIYRSVVPHTYTNVNYYDTTGPFNFNDIGQAPTGTGTPVTFTNAWMSKIAVETAMNSWLLASDNTMKLGIGGTAPAEKLHVIGAGNNFRVDADTLSRRFKANQGTALVAGDFALSAGWGSTALVSPITGTDQGWNITITAQGTGYTGSPTVTLTFKDGTWTNVPICISKMVGGTGLRMDLDDSPTTTTWIMRYNDFPVNGKTYILSGIVMGR